jgi:hypothetical protein
MRTLAGFSMALLFSGALFGQYHFGAPIFTAGNAVFPAGTSATNPNIQRFTSTAAYRSSARRTPVTTGTGAIAVPYAYPVYVGSGYTDGSYSGAGPYGTGSSAGAPATQQPNVVVVYPPQPAPVIINQFGPGSMPPPEAGDRQPVSPYQPATDRSDDQDSADHYLIALKDHTIYSVVAYWVDGDTLHYFTAGNVHNQASLSLVDRDLTARLNKESGLEVNLPPAAK